MAVISFQGKPLNTCGDLPAVGSTAPDFSLVNGNLKEVTLATYAGKKKVLNIVPSLDTPTCAASALMFNQKVAHFDNTVLLQISADLPFAQGRFCENEGLHHITPLSTFRSRFGKDYGVELVDSILKGLTARAVIVLDADNKVLYTELVKELADEPNYASALAVL